GNSIDMFAKTGLYIVAARLFSMSVEQGLRFYGFLEDVFVERLSFLVDRTLRQSLAHAFPFPLGDGDFAAMTEILRQKNARHEVARIIEYMTGTYPGEEPPAAARNRPGATKCLALLYQGEDAIARIREKLGSTDPAKAESGTVRSDYGTDLMKNGAHASDSLKSALRERSIVGLSGREKSDEKRLIHAFLKGRLSAFLKRSPFAGLRNP
ncbi:MAG: nucleoside-diphosphate kinase, partial [Planctomycetota bacterium]